MIQNHVYEWHCESHSRAFQISQNPNGILNEGVFEVRNALTVSDQPEFNCSKRFHAILGELDVEIRCLVYAVPPVNDLRILWEASENAAQANTTAGSTSSTGMYA